MRNILIAYDGSEMRKAAINEVETLFSHNGNTKICVISISNISNPHTNAMMQRKIMDEDVKKIQKEHDEKAKKEHVEKIKLQLDEIKNRLENNGTTVDTNVLMMEGNNNPGEKICKYATSYNYDLIVVGSRGLGNIKKVILGSVSNYVVNNSDKPVLVIK